MNLKQTNILLLLILLVSSCSLTELTVNKRLYNKGFYVNFKNNEENNVVEILRKIDTDSVKNKLEIQENKSELTASNFVNESQNAVQNDFENIILPVKRTKLEPSKSLNKKIIFTKNIKTIEPEEKKAKRLSISSIILSILAPTLVLISFLPLFGNALFIVSFIISPFFIILAILFAFKAINIYKKLQKNSIWKYVSMFSIILAIIAGVVWSYSSFIMVIMRLFSGLY